MGRSPGVADPNRIKRDELIIARLREGALAPEIAAEFGLAESYCTSLCGSLRRQNGIPAPSGRRRKISCEKEHADALKEVVRHLGPDFVAAHVEARDSVTYLDDGQTLEVLRLHAALRLVLLDAADLVLPVIKRLRRVEREKVEQAVAR